MFLFMQLCREIDMERKRRSNTNVRRTKDVSK